MPREYALDRELIERARALVEAAPPDFDWEPLEKFIDEIILELPRIYGIIVNDILKLEDEIRQANKLKR